MPTVSTRVIVRNNMGRFIADVKGAAPKVVDDCLDVGIRASRAKAPSRTGKLKRSFNKVILSRTSGVFTNTAPYAVFQDQGAGPHPMNAWVRFYWEKAGRIWLHPDEYWMLTGKWGADPINHPGNPATHFMDAGYQAIRRAMPSILKRHYPD